MPPMRDGCYVQDGVKVQQPTHQPVVDPVEGIKLFKGTQAILLERGLEVGQLNGDCKAKVGLEKPAEFCCCKHVLANQPDFLAQKTALEELAEANNHLALMLPKCHPGTCAEHTLRACTLAGARGGAGALAACACTGRSARACVRVGDAAVHEAHGRVALDVCVPACDCVCRVPDPPPPPPRTHATTATTCPPQS